MELQGSFLEDAGGEGQTEVRDFEALGGVAGEDRADAFLFGDAIQDFGAQDRCFVRVVAPLVPVGHALPEIRAGEREAGDFDLRFRLADGADIAGAGFDGVHNDFA